MSGMLHYGSTALALILLAIREVISCVALKHLQYDKKTADIYLYKSLVISGTLLFLMCLFPIPLSVFYCLLYIEKCLLYFPMKGKLEKGWFYINIIFILYITIHMISIGILALTVRRDISIVEVIADPVLRTVSLSFAVLVQILLELWLICHAESMKAVSSVSERGVGFMFSKFLWFCVVCAMADSFLCLNDSLDAPITFFLIGSNLLLLLLLLSFLRNSYSIARNIHLEEEHQRLEKEQKEGMERTESLKKTASVDLLTGAYTRRYAMNFMRTLMDELTHFVVVYLDLDHLKQINDSMGHQAGDQYLTDFARIFRDSLRKEDIFARVGGDEFLVIMPGCSQEEAYQRISRVRDEMEKGRHGATAIAFSFGAVCYDSEEEMNLEQLLGEADRSMYADKRLRR